MFQGTGLNLQYRYPKADAVILDKEKRYSLHTSPLKMFSRDSYLWQFTFRERISMACIVYYLFKKNIDLPDITFLDFTKLFTSSQRLLKVIDQCMIFANGTYSESASLIELKESQKAADYNKECLVVGGCRRLIEELTAYITRNGGELFNKVPVSKINLKGNRVTGVTLAQGRQVKADRVVTNVGPKRTRQLLGAHTPTWFIEKKKAFAPAIGISYALASDSPLLAHDCIEVPVDYNDICGYVQVSNLDPGLAPPGKHLLLAAQMFRNPELKISEVIQRGIDDLLDLFPQISRENIINISSFHKDWLAVPTGQFIGQTGTNRYPLKLDPFENLFMLSHDSQGWGFAADIIGHAALNFEKMI